MSASLVIIATLALQATPYDFTPYYLDDPALTRAYEAFKTGAHKTADRELEQWLSTARHSDRSDAVRFLRAEVLARRAKRAGRRGGKAFAEERLRLLDELRRRPQFASAANLSLGQHYERRGDVRRALEHYEAIEPGAAGYVDANLSAIKLLLKKKRGIEALRRVDALTRTGVSRRSALELRLLRGQALAAAGKKDAAITALMDLWTDHAERSIGRAAQRELRRLKHAPSRSDQLALEFSDTTSGSTKRLQQRLRKLKRKLRRTSKAANHFVQGVIAEVGRDKPAVARRLYARAARARSHYVRGLAEYRLARLTAKDNPDRAVTLWESMARTLPNHPLAPRALIEAAEVARRIGRESREKAVLERLARRYKDHPKRAQHLWDLAWSSWRDGQTRRALGHWETIADDHGRERHLGQATWGERATYWQARAHLALNDRPRAISLFETLVTERPLSYYSHQAFNRVCELDKTRCSRHRQRKPGDPFDLRSPIDVSQLRIEPSPTLDTAVAMLKVGLFDRAHDELRARSRAGQLHSDGLRLLVGLGLRLGRDGHRTGVIGWRGTLPGYPEGPGEALWRLAYPLPFWSSVEKWANDAGVSPWLVIALIRHESRYNPKVTSHAKAIGLMQLLVGTARGVAKAMDLDLSISRRTLREPDTNIRLGSRFLRELLRLFKDNEALALAAYNAGPGRAKQWWTRFRTERRNETDEFIEEIPFKETHSYVKSVLASYGVYRYVYGDPADHANRTIPLESALPDELGQYFSRSGR